MERRQKLWFWLCNIFIEQKIRAHTFYSLSEKGEQSKHNGRPREMDKNN